jgi:DNA mismatch repair protein MSH6
MSVLTTGPRTKRTVTDDDDESDVYMPNAKEDDDEIESISAGEPTPSVSSSGTSPESPVRKLTSSKLSKFDASTQSSSTPSTPLYQPKSAIGAFGKSVNKEERVKNFTEKNKDRYSWLLDIRDKEGNRPGEESYDPRTIYIPSSAWKSFTAFEKQYW